MTLKNLTRSTAFAALAVAFAVPTFAQEAGLDVVITTAQKRSENAQEVPVSVATLDGEAFERIQQGGEDILALAARVPGVYAESSNGRLAPRFYIRGLGNVDFDLAASQPVSIIIDDVVQENVLLKSNPIFDSERVEIFRGPQGTLFGRNTPAGIIKFDSRRPTQEFTGDLSASYGSFNTVVVDAGVGGALIEDVASFRVSGLFRQRDDYIDNVTLNTSGDDIGEFEEFAGRVQLLVEPSENLDILLNAHGRTHDGTAAVFRANILQPLTGGLTSDFDRNEVFFDGGEDNNQTAETYGFSGRADYGFGDFTLTSITGFEAGKSSSIGDIDGGTGAVFLPQGSFPGPIPFPSVTRGSLEGLTQFSQEIRLASDNTSGFTWQVGGYYFDTEFDVVTEGEGFPPRTVVTHGNEAFAAFGQVGYDLTDALTVKGGLRYTDETRTFSAPTPPPGVTVNPTEVSDDNVSWDLSALYRASDNVNLFARVARGFRGPSIQGRDVAFAAFSGRVDPQSVATSETIQSYEAGFKSEFADNRIRLNATAFYYEIDDQQFSIVGGVDNTNRVVNADQGRGLGFEVDLSAQLAPSFFVQGGLGYANTEIQDDTLATPPCGSGLCTPTDPRNAIGSALVDGNPFPNAPELTANAFAEYTTDTSNGEIFINADVAYQGKTNIFLYEAPEFQTNGNTEVGAALGYRDASTGYQVSVFARNLTNAENIKGAIDFNNLTGFVNDPRVVGVAISGGF
jgi:outer membrane receptor protein involved in Fe transport